MVSEKKLTTGVTVRSVDPLAFANALEKAQGGRIIATPKPDNLRLGGSGGNIPRPFVR